MLPHKAYLSPYLYINQSQTLTLFSLINCLTLSFGVIGMNNEIHMCKNSQLTIKEQENPGVRCSSPYLQNVPIDLAVFNEEAFIGSTVLLTRHYSDTVIFFTDDSSDRTTAIARKTGAQVIVNSFFEENLLPRR